MEYRGMNSFGFGLELRRLKQQAYESFDGILPTTKSRELESEREKLFEYIAASQMTDAFKCFMVDFVGTANTTLSEADLLVFLEGAEMSQKCGTLCGVVESWLKNRHAKLTDKGYGNASWHLGAYCTPGEAWLLVRDGSRKFEKAIQAGLLSIKMSPWPMEYQG